jgi:hypothetical protein
MPELSLKLTQMLDHIAGADAALTARYRDLL